jgi:hypothetical protein
MKKIILIIIFLGVCSFLYKNFLKENNTQITTSGNNMVLESGDNKFIAKITSDYKKDLRIYGITDNNEQGWSPFAYATYIFTASPSTGNTEDCERNDALNAQLLNIIVKDKDIKNKINKLKSMKGRRSATVVGKKVYIKQFMYKDENHTGALKKQGQLDPHNAIIIDDIVALE